jgi:hypothetical protein
LFCQCYLGKTHTVELLPFQDYLGKTRAVKVDSNAYSLSRLFTTVQSKDVECNKLARSDRLREFPSLDLVEILHDFSFHLEAV